MMHLLSTMQMEKLHVIFEKEPYGPTVLTALPFSPTTAQITLVVPRDAQLGLPISMPPILAQPVHPAPLKEFVHTAASEATAAQPSWPATVWAQEVPGPTEPPRPDHPLQL